MRRPPTVTLARLFGVRIGAAPSWFLFLGIAVVFLTSSFGTWIPSASNGELFVMAVVAALAFSLAIALHELGHALVARRFGIDVIGIDLWVLGGFTHLSREPQRPREELLIAIAGPLVNLVLAGMALGLTALALPSDLTLGDALTGTETTEPLVVLGAWLALINAGLLLFNLLPGYPLDGGRIAQALIWGATGDKARATVLAGRAGRLFGGLIVGSGVLLLWYDDTVAGLSLIVLGWFLSQGARGATLVGEFQQRLSGVTAADVMDPSPKTITGTTTATEALDSYPAIASAPIAVPVIDTAGKLLGVLTRERLEHALSQGRPLLTAADLIADHGPGPEEILGDASLEQLLKSERLQQWGVIPVVDATGSLRGLVTADRVRRVLQR